MLKRSLAGLFLIWAVLMTSAAMAADAPAASSDPPWVGGWVGARLQCRKDESGPVKCGTPSPFRVVFQADGTGLAQGDNFPAAFTWSVAAPGKMTVTPKDGTRKLELFDLKVESDFISFQAYIYPDTKKEEGEEYIHYVFDLAREEPPPQ
jgi:hypothetical protein